jgi:hypothetical protein
MKDCIKKAKSIGHSVTSKKLKDIFMVCRQQIPHRGTLWEEPKAWILTGSFGCKQMMSIRKKYYTHNLGRISLEVSFPSLLA